MRSFAPYLEVATRAAHAAGDLLRADFHRPTGPRGEHDKAPADTEAEQLIRGILLGATGDFGFLGEETGRVPGAPGAPIWVVDPNDGTRDYIKGRRGSSVSIALVWDHKPVLGVVRSFGYPDDLGVTYSAAIGREGVFKDGARVVTTLPERLGEDDVVLVSGGADRAARANLHCTRPARVLSIPSIAHRLAKVAAGEASATTSLYAPKTWDFAAGHCLILAAGGVAVDQMGLDPFYDDEGSGESSRLFAGSQTVATDLASRNWDLAFESERETSMPIVRLRKGGAIADPGLLGRAQGAFLGHLAGSALSVAAAPPSGRPLPRGQIGSSGEIAVSIARSILDFASDDHGLRRAYMAWASSGPSVPDRAITALAAGHPLSDILSPSALVRVTPLALWGHDADPALLAAKARSDASLSHPSPIAGDAAAALAVGLQSLLHRGDPLATIGVTHAFARRSGSSRAVIDAIVNSGDPIRPAPGAGDGADLLFVVQAVLSLLTRATSFEDAVASAIALSPTSDALPSIVGAFAGARFGRDGIQERLRNHVLSCRPLEGLAACPRPPVYWTTDAMAMAEALLTSR